MDNNNMDNMDNNNAEQALDLIIKQAEIAKENIKMMKEMQLEMRKNKNDVIKVSEFLIGFYNEYRDHDALTLAQVKEMKQLQHSKTSEITRILCPRITESRKRGEAYLKEWNKVNKGLWSIFKTKVNGVSIPYDRTPKVKFKQAMEYLDSLTVADYLAYREERWDDIKDFVFNESLVEKKITIEDIIDNNDEGNGNIGLLQ